MNNLETLDLNPKVLHALKKVHLVTYEAVLSRSEPDLVRVTGLTVGDVRGLKDAVAEAAIKRPSINGLDLWRQSALQGGVHSRRLSTGCSVLDRALHGGLLCQGVTEVVGESASGKTQLCLQLCLSVQLPPSQGGLGGGALYICTEGVFPNKRLFQLLEHFSRLHPRPRPPSYSDSILVEHVADLDGLSRLLQTRVPGLLTSGRVRLLVLDSVAALFRCDFSAGQAAQRSRPLTSIGAQLRSLASRHACPVVCVNQVTADVRGDHGKREGTEAGVSGGGAIPALGLAWANQVTSRLVLTRSSPLAAVCRRHLHVAFAPHLPRVTLPFTIDARGLRGLEKDEET